MSRNKIFALTIFTVCLLGTFAFAGDIEYGGGEISCMAPCSYNSETGATYCPCPGVNTIVNPEPITMLLFGSGLVGAVILKRKRG